MSTQQELTTRPATRIARWSDDGEKLLKPDASNEGVGGSEASAGQLRALAAQLDPLIVVAITRDGNGAATSAGVVWPDGATGTYTALVVSTAFPGAVDSYSVTRVVSGVTTTYTQPAVTRDSAGAVITRPAIAES